MRLPFSANLPEPGGDDHRRFHADCDALTNDVRHGRGRCHDDGERFRGFLDAGVTGMPKNSGATRIDRVDFSPEGQAGENIASSDPDPIS